jgi:hypothetical protein
MQSEAIKGNLTVVFTGFYGKISDSKLFQIFYEIQESLAAPDFPVYGIFDCRFTTITTTILHFPVNVLHFSRKPIVTGLHVFFTGFTGFYGTLLTQSATRFVMV